MNVHRFLFRTLLGRRLPRTSGTIEVPGISRAVTIRRDTYGIPYVEAESDEDAWYGVGFCQGQDRAFQIDSMARVARGTLSELVGKPGLPVDRLSRQVGFSRGTAEQLDVIAPHIRKVLDSFARGVTDGMTLGSKRRAHEFVLLRCKPTPYTAADVLAVGRLQAFVLALNWDIELARYHILKMDGPQALSDLDPTYPEWHPLISPPGEVQGPMADQLASDIAALRDVMGHSGGSNNWAVAPSLTPTGHPLLANDPHLRPSLPPHWYLTQIRTPDWAAAGATFVGVPVLPAGHNGHAAWGVTAGLVDNTDLFLEELGPDGRSVRQGDGFVECEVRDEVIHVKGGDDVTERVVITPRGPLVGSLVGDGVAMSLRATWLDPRPVEGLLTVHLVKSFEDLRQACRQWPAYSLNVVYADTSGTIGWQLIGDAPQRRGGSGTMPRPGWLPDSGWEDDPLPFEQLPYAVDPPEGYLATANNSPVREEGGPFLGVDWLDGYRAARILEMLGDGKGRDVDSALKLQMDTHSIAWREMRDTVLSVSPANEGGRRALELLGDWDGDLAPDSIAASVFQHFLSVMYRRVAQARAPKSWKWALGNGDNLIQPHTLLVARRTGHLARLLRDRPDGWFAAGWDHTVEDALTEAVDTLNKNHESQAWGQIRPLTLVHPVAAEQKLFAPIFNRGPFPWGGDANTVSQAAALTEDSTSNPMAIASLRMVVDVGNWEESRFILPGGQSGNPLSPHYDDMIPLWQRGEGVPIAWSPERVASVARDTLVLMPTTD
jgi:penicillin amidase